MASIESTEGTIQFRHSSLPGGSAETWYRIVGKLQPDSTPLVLLHGGPGITSIIFEDVFDKYVAQSGNPVILYDQIGCGRSTHFPQTRLDNSVWKPELFVDELENLLKGLGVTTFDLYGHSWGALIAAQFAVTDSPFVGHLQKLILASGLTCSSLWMASLQELLKKMPQSVQDAIKTGEREKDYKSEAYQNAIVAFYNEFVCKTVPWPQALTDAAGEIEKDDTVYLTMWGPSEVTITGNLKDYDLGPQLHKIKVPTLLINGEFDEATDEVLKPCFKSIEKVKWVTMSDVAHVGFLEQPDKYISIVAEFLAL
ncbi:Alpha/Beta hydrolase protein [Trichoderma austrokoningii]